MNILQIQRVGLTFPSIRRQNKRRIISFACIYPNNIHIERVGHNIIYPKHTLSGSWTKNAPTGHNHMQQNKREYDFLTRGETLKILRVFPAENMPVWMNRQKTIGIMCNKRKELFLPGTKKPAPYGEPARNRPEKDYIDLIIRIL